MPTKLCGDYYGYWVKGILGKTQPNVSPESFVITGECYEEWTIKGKFFKRSGVDREIIVPNDLNKIIHFLKRLSLGTLVIFKESAGRTKNKKFNHYSSVEVVQKNLRKKRRESSRV